MINCKVDEDLELRLCEVKYAAQLYDLVNSNRAHLREWLPWVDGTRSAAYIQMFLESCIRQHAANNGFNYLMFYQGELVGNIGLHSIDWTHKKTSIGYWLATGFEGKGLMTKSCCAVVDHLFGVMQLNRVEIKVGELNAKSRAIPERLGFKQEGVVRQAEWLYDHYIDHVIYGMLAREWDAKR
ncbi:GNAT family N-acetyltransferase [Paenibacillus sp. LMG 31456]|uniref:GNAT family N-acetyltransferase n=1 Tax=Paenibacillus foliorum TaxID=2654974 RepID=A0A972GVJ3_9BACL|nr:GNAT family protein [Paenibacillus foliorum]NOU97691.1 GNAT family N-acetyltransferase [Paenibacillus foliorum]